MKRGRDSFQRNETGSRLVRVSVPADTGFPPSRYPAGVAAPASGTTLGIATGLVQAHRGRPRGTNRGFPGAGWSGAWSGPDRGACTRARLHQTHTLK
jgi:hypothetical protein